MICRQHKSCPDRWKLGTLGLYGGEKCICSSPTTVQQAWPHVRTIPPNPQQPPAGITQVDWQLDGARRLVRSNTFFLAHFHWRPQALPGLIPGEDAETPYCLPLPPRVIGRAATACTRAARVPCGMHGESGARCAHFCPKPPLKSPSKPPSPLRNSPGACTGGP